MAGWLRSVRVTSIVVLQKKILNGMSEDIREKLINAMDTRLKIEAEGDPVSGDC